MQRRNTGSGAPVILKLIARQEGIEVEEADVNNRIAAKAEEFGTTKEALLERA